MKSNNIKQVLKVNLKFRLARSKQLTLIQHKQYKSRQMYTI